MLAAPAFLFLPIRYACCSFLLIPAFMSAAPTFLFLLICLLLRPFYSCLYVMLAAPSFLFLPICMLLLPFYSCLAACWLIKLHYAGYSFTHTSCTSFSYQPHIRNVRGVNVILVQLFSKIQSNYKFKFFGPSEVQGASKYYRHSKTPENWL
jgi:hypothetical protein